MTGMTDHRVFRSIPIARATFALFVMLFSDKGGGHALVCRAVCRFLRREYDWFSMWYSSVEVDGTLIVTGSTRSGFQRSHKYQDFCQLHTAPQFSVFTAHFEVSVCGRPWDFSHVLTSCSPALLPGPPGSCCYSWQWVWASGSCVTSQPKKPERFTGKLRLECMGDMESYLSHCVGPQAT